MAKQRNRRLAQPREQVLAAAVEMIAEHGLATLTMARLAERLGTSGGHLLYYFGTRDGLLLETLRWSEENYAAERAPIRDDVLAFAAVYLPLDRRDPRWLLWLELWARAPYDEAMAQAQRDLDDAWHVDLVAVLAAAHPTLADPVAVSQRLRAMWDGFAIAIINGGGRELRTEVLEHTRALLR